VKLNGVQETFINFAPRHYICKRAKEKLSIDGKIDKNFWKDAPWSDNFTDIEGDIRPQPAKRTRVKMLWDDEYLYFGAEMEEDRIWATLTERDCVVFFDNDFEIFIDPDGDTHNYYEFEMNAFNTLWDLFLTKPYRDNGRPVNSWDIKGIKTAVQIKGEINNPEADNIGWSVEVAMPWSVLKECAPGQRPPRNGEYWRINFSRVEWRTEIVDGKYSKCINPDTGKPYPEDNWVWSPTGVVNMHYPELWGFVVFAEETIDFTIPEDEFIKWELRKMYYRQRNYYEKKGRFCSCFDEIRGNDKWTINPSIETTSSLFQISAPSSDRRGQICIREDGQTWRE
jgi:hypothetical protein